ncbi:hypothetical protein BDV28DRAFT_112934 [Aspergillus coremiiformis]|uniref:C2H2-type domain-containing protein n=1 Tax=Aspergillus coremiiformis TaxID=138285 RepID=A0A5N6YRG6_9EURO|nr:hypothetical protein BDV28DRAFT_112934 [Aspergillus coremiiformis]
MEQAPTSCSSPSTLLRSPPDSYIMLDATAAYSSPMCSTSSFPSNSQPTMGLGISHCEMEGPSSQLRLFPPETYPSPVTDWSNHWMPPESLLETTLDVGHFSPGPCYEPFGGHSDVSVSPLSYYSPHTLNTSSSYGSAVEFGGHSGTLSAPSRFWPNTPHSDATSSEIQTLVKEESDESLDHPLLAEICNSTGIVVVPPMPQVVGNDTCSNRQPLQGDDRGALVELNPAADHHVDNNRKGAALHRPFEMVFQLTKSDSELPGERHRIPSASGLECTICGSRFTRRSNCREHMKRHDPNLRKSYHCEFCERPFGRRTDLRRHVDSIHHGIRKFGCEHCGQRFSRHDTLSRHKIDGCHRRPRNSDVSRETDAMKASQYLPGVSPHDSPDINKQGLSLPKH